MKFRKQIFPDNEINKKFYKKIIIYHPFIREKSKIIYYPIIWISKVLNTPNFVYLGIHLKYKNKLYTLRII